ncbi:hypothetical protein BCR34DRAFT_588876 [Clohesyomyces aquaticus]|uniref:Uncharacterized protein n=1 Tax=Clohesyomyces aquaticus TaxID=1231657 RepID=A0A1Y1ZJ49_9PLEO|nr:hypothetical protein BCR34DRAFT_588876 [Clohesyomyces aquaticus]
MEPPLAATQAFLKHGVPHLAASRPRSRALADLAAQRNEGSAVLCVTAAAAAPRRPLAAGIVRWVKISVAAAAPSSPSPERPSLFFVCLFRAHLRPVHVAPLAVAVAASDHPGLAHAKEKKKDTSPLVPLGLLHCGGAAERGEGAIPYTVHQYGVWTVTLSCSWRSSPGGVLEALWQHVAAAHGHSPLRQHPERVRIERLRRPCREG